MTTHDTGCGSITAQRCDFTIASEGTITGDAPCTAAGSQVWINGSPDLSKIIVGPKGAAIKSIVYEAMDGIARNSVVYVYGQGPEGMGSGSIKLYFYTANTGPDHPHDLTVSSSTPDCHNDKFSDGSDITKITWEHT